MNKGEGRVRVRRAVIKVELQIPSPRSPPLSQMGEAIALQRNATRPRTSNRRDQIVFLAIACFCVTSCATVSRHEFSEPTSGWQTKSGQLMYRTPKSTLIGEALVRFSKT